MIVLSALLLAFSNGANDNSKGVATLYGSGASNYGRALGWATAATLAGSMAAVFASRELLASFSGQGLVAPELVGAPRFVAAVATGAWATVLLATRFGLPVSTTHALMGGLVGAGLAASPRGIELAALGRGFIVPLLVGPWVAAAAGSALYSPLPYFRRRTGVAKESCVCVGGDSVGATPSGVVVRALPLVASGPASACRARYAGLFRGISARQALDAAHYASAGMVSFARGFNDTPKIAALLLASPVLTADSALCIVGAAIAVGGLVGARRVAETMSYRITELTPGQGFVANIVTSLLVVGATGLGLPASTTHVSCGALFGIGLTTRRTRWKMVRTLIAAWVTTVPLAALLAAAAFGIL